MVKTKRLIRSRVWFESIDNAVESKVKKCKECQATTDKPAYEPIKPSTMPEVPCHTVAGDFYGPMADGNYWFVNICEHSQWASVDKVRRTDEEHTEKVLERLFNTFGSSTVVYKSDNGSPFQSHRLSEFAKKWDFKHRRVTPEWPRVNGKAESFNEETRQSSPYEQHKWLTQGPGSLQAYRETSHSSTGVAPNHLMFGFSRSSGIPKRQAKERRGNGEQWPTTQELKSA
jgi:transposase InsO family protein